MCYDSGARWPHGNFPPRPPVPRLVPARRGHAVPRLRASIAALALLLFATACGDERAPVTGPAAMLPPAAVETTGLEWIVLLDGEADPLQLALDYGLALLESDPAAQLALLAGSIDPAVLLADARVQLAQSNVVVVFSEPEDVTQGFHQGDWPEEEIAGQDALAPLRAHQLFHVTRGEGTVVAVLDTGADLDHPHLDGRLVISGDVPPDLGQAETSDGVDNDADGDVDEAHGHGTHVAGIVLSVAPGSRVLPIRIMNDDGIGNAYDLCRGLHHAMELGADIVNMSLVLSNQSPVVADFLAQLHAANILLVAAAGNDPGTVGYPASDPHVVGVAASDATDGLASFSGRGGVPFAAPGVAVESSFPGGGSALASGTSMAAPALAGSAALLRASPWGSTGLATLELMGLGAAPLRPGEGVVHGRVAPLRVLKQLDEGGGGALLLEPLPPCDPPCATDGRAGGSYRG